MMHIYGLNNSIIEVQLKNLEPWNPPHHFKQWFWNIIILFLRNYYYKSIFYAYTYCPSCKKVYYI